jgi:1,4-dihydroxy-2-naphthoate octaprenyltransferase
MSLQKAITGYGLIMVATYLTIVVGVALGIMPWPTLIALLTIPLAWKAVKGLRKNHSFPYRLIPANANTVFAHLYTGLLLFAGYLMVGLVGLF